MTLPYKRAFQGGRQSDQLLNDELHQIVELVRHLAYEPENGIDEPEGKLTGSIWVDTSTNEMKRYDTRTRTWIPIYGKQLKLITHITDELQPENPEVGQLWIQNGVLMWFDGTKWNAARTLLQDGTKFSLAAFEDFILSSPLSSEDNVLLTGDGPSKQFLVPRYDIDRIFLGNSLTDKTRKISPVCAELSKTDIGSDRVSLVHINSGKLTRIKKRLVHVDKKNPVIKIPAANTEYYGFQKNSHYGSFLFPHTETSDGGYNILASGISLPYEMAQDYEYVLAITYEFSWMKSTGDFIHLLGSDTTKRSCIQNGKAPYTMFVEGYSLNELDCSMDPLSQTFEIYEGDPDTLEILAMHCIKPEDGDISYCDMDGNGIIHPHTLYTSPLLFVDGQALHPDLMDISYDGEEFIVRNAKRGMSWRAIDLWDEEHMYDMFEDAGHITHYTDDRTPAILFDTNHIRPEDDIILFVDGILIRKDEITRDDSTGKLTVSGLRVTDKDPAMDYILLKDRYQVLYPGDRIRPAIPLSVFNESLIYVDGKLICNDSAVKEFRMQDDVVAASPLVNGEVKNFINYTDESKAGYFKWNAGSSTWTKMKDEDIVSCEAVTESYRNSYKAIGFNIDIQDKLDSLHIYAYRYANVIESPLEIYNIDVTEKQRIEVPVGFQHGLGQLRVWCNGVRIYPDAPLYPGIVEDTKGFWFDLPDVFTGRVTYIIERTESGQARSASMEILDHRNLLPGHINVYRTEKTMFPGRTTVYLNGVRLSTGDYTVHDNHTLIINGDEPLLGDPSNYPTEKITNGKHSVDVTHNMPDCLLVEVRQDSRQERTITVDRRPMYGINVAAYKIDAGMLDTQDEILIFADGLYAGASMNVGYRKDVSSGTLDIMDDSILATVNGDELELKLLGDGNAEALYIAQNGTAYERSPQKLTLEWR